MRYIPRYSMPESMSIRLDIGTEINLLSKEVTVIYFLVKGPPNQTKFILAQSPEEEVFFYDPYKKYDNIRITNNTVECNLNITEPGNYTFWVEVFYNEHKFISDSCDAYFE